MSKEVIKQAPDTPKPEIPEFGVSFGDQLDQKLGVVRLPVDDETKVPQTEDEKAEKVASDNELSDRLFNNKKKEPEPPKVVEEVKEPEKVEDVPEPDQSTEDDIDSLELSKKLLTDDIDADVTVDPVKVDDVEGVSDEVDEELEAIRDNPHTPEKTRKSIDRLRESNRQLKEELKKSKGDVDETTKLREEIKALRENPANKEGVNDTEKTELQMLRRRFALENDETIRKEYDERITANENILIEILDKTLDTGEEGRKSLDKIKSVGFVEFAKKNPRVYTKFLEDLEEIDPVQASIVRNKVGEVESLKYLRTQKIGELSKDADKYFAEQEAQSKAAIEAQREQENETQKFYQGFREQLVTADPVFATIDTSALLGEAKVKAESENKKRTTYQKDIDTILSAHNPEEVKTVIYKAALHRPLVNRVTELTAKLKKLTEEKAAIAKARQVREERVPHTPAPDKQTKPMSFNDMLDAAVKGRA